MRASGMRVWLIRLVCGSAILCAGSLPASAAQIAYPAKGQSAAQQAKDDGECYAWAKSRTGVDPVATSSAPQPESKPAIGNGERVTGAVRGAVIGGIVDGSDGAAKGAGVGVVLGGVQARNNQRAREAQQEAYRQDELDSFNRAHAACMEGRGYSVR